MLGGKRERFDVKAHCDDLKAAEMQRQQRQQEDRQQGQKDVGFKPKKK